MKYDSTSQVTLRESYLKLKKDLGFDTEEIAKAYLKHYPIDTRHKVVWLDETSSSEHSKEIFYGIYAESGKLHLIDEPFENKDDAIKNVKERTKEWRDDKEIDDKLLKMMVLTFYEHQMYVGTNTKKDEIRPLSGMKRDDDAKGGKINLKRVIEALEDIENYSMNNDIPARPYNTPLKYRDVSEEHRNKIIQDYIHEWNDKDQSIHFTENNTIAFGSGAKYSNKKESKPKISKEKKINKSSSFDMNFCVSIINFLEEEISSLMATAAEVLSDSHKWRIENGIEEEGPRLALISKESKDWPIGAKQGDCLKKTIKHMITENFDCQIIFSESKQCIGTLKLSTLSTQIALHKYDNTGETIDVSKLNKLELIERSPIMIDALEPLCRFSNKLGEIDIVLFHWDPINNPLHKELLEDRNPLLMPGIHVITSHDILAHGISQNN